MYIEYVWDIHGNALIQCFHFPLSGLSSFDLIILHIVSHNVLSRPSCLFRFYQTSVVTFLSTYFLQQGQNRRLLESSTNMTATSSASLASSEDDVQSLDVPVFLGLRQCYHYHYYCCHK